MALSREKVPALDGTVNAVDGHHGRKKAGMCTDDVGACSSWAVPSSRRAGDGTQTVMSEELALKDGPYSRSFMRSRICLEES